MTSEIRIDAQTNGLYSLTIGNRREEGLTFDEAMKIIESEEREKDVSQTVPKT